jgi:hypothetical protein
MHTTNKGEKLMKRYKLVKEDAYSMTFYSMNWKSTIHQIPKQKNPISNMLMGFKIFIY